MMDWRRSALVPVLFAYAASRVFWLILGGSRTGAFDSPAPVGLLKVGVFVLPALAVAMLITRVRLPAAVHWLGLDGRVLHGYGFAAAATLPMAIVLLVGGLPSPRLDAVADSLLLGPLAEEVLFRGFLLTVLVRVAGWRPGPAILASALLFGMAHTPAPVVLGTVARVLAGLAPPLDLLLSASRETMAFATGGVLFGWIYYRWGSLWPAIGLHAGINLWWDLSVGPSGRAPDPLLSAGLGIAQGLAVLLAIGLTLLLTSGRHGEPAGRTAVVPSDPPVGHAAD